MMYYIIIGNNKGPKYIKRVTPNIGLAKKFVWLVNMLFNRVLHENEKCLLFLLKTE